MNSKIEEYKEASCMHFLGPVSHTKALGFYFEEDGKPLRLEDIVHTLLICHSLGHPSSVRIC